MHKGVAAESHDERSELNKRGVVSAGFISAGNTSDCGSRADMSMSSLVSIVKCASGNKSSSGGISLKRSAIELKSGSVSSGGGEGDIDPGMTVDSLVDCILGATR